MTEQHERAAHERCAVAVDRAARALPAREPATRQEAREALDAWIEARRALIAAQRRAERAAAPAPQGSEPWQITEAAVLDYLWIARRRSAYERARNGARDASYVRAERELAEQAQATAASGRVPHRLDSGRLRHRGPRPGRLGLVVDPDAIPPALVEVLPWSERIDGVYPPHRHGERT